MDFVEKILKLRKDYFKTNLVYPDELWLGRVEKNKLNKYIKSNTFLSTEINLHSLEKSETEFLGMKVKFKDENSCCFVDDKIWNTII